MTKFFDSHEFIPRHIGPSLTEQAEMMALLGVSSLDELTKTTLPEAIQFNGDLQVGEGVTEHEALVQLREMAQQNEVFRSYIGQGYYGTFVPPVVLRNILENPGWYTAYTPYQAEISQGRLEMLLNFQQLVIDLTALPVANASLLDEATAAAEAMTLAKRAGKNKGNAFWVHEDTYPQTLDVIKTRAEYFGFEVVVGGLAELQAREDIFGAYIQQIGNSGTVYNLKEFAEAIQAKQGLLIAGADLLAAVLVQPVGEQGADIAIGNAQRFGVPMGFGGPHAAFMSCREGLQRSMPGRIIGVSRDASGKTALRMAMQTREQHIRREKATSNICTAQALLANMTAAYAVWHGPEGLKRIAGRVHAIAAALREMLVAKGFEVQAHFFDTLFIQMDDAAASAVKERATAQKINFAYPKGGVRVSFDETTTMTDLTDVASVLLGETVDAPALPEASALPAELQRTSEFLTHEVFGAHHSEHAMLRYLKKLENKDYSLVHGMIPLGSCTMKLNATTEMIPVTWPEFGNMHPFAPSEQTKGYAAMLSELERWLTDVTGYDAVSLQPNSGAQGEYAGLLTIRKYQEANGQGHRDVCLIPASAHGTNPASAAMMGLKVVVVKTDESGNIDMDDLRAQAEKHKDNLSSLMITYPSTHGVYEENVTEVCEIIHASGGQVYLDGANMNAQVGIAKPGLIGSDVSHLNLHKTFAIPHGGGGPGMGPIGVKAHLAPHLPNHSEVSLGESKTGAVSAAPFGSASILPISYLYMKLLGSRGLRESTQVALLSANYIAKKLGEAYPVLYTGKNDRVAHECIIDIRPIKAATGISEEDIAKRLMDYGFHAPTMSFPVPGTLMIEPTESEPKAELDRFIEAMLSIRAEIAEVEAGKVSAEDSVLRHAPHTQATVTADEWNRPYSRQVAAFPTAHTRAAKFWPTVSRVDNVYGDRNFVCTCPPTSDWAE